MQCLVDWTKDEDIKAFNHKGQTTMIAVYLKGQATMIAAYHRGSGHNDRGR